MRSWRARAGQAAALLREVGVGPGDRVALMLPNVLAFPVLFYGSLAAGAAVVPMNPLLKSREVAHYLGDSGASVIFAWEPVRGRGGQGRGRHRRPGHPGDGTGRPEPCSATGSRWRTGPSAATTTTPSSCTPPGRPGVPKGAELTHANLYRNAEVTTTTLLTAGQDDVIMGCLPLFHVLRPDLRHERVGHRAAPA